MTDLSARLREVIEERQLAATSLQRRAQEHDLERQEPKLLGRVIPGWYEWPEVERLAADAILAGEHALGVLERHSPASDLPRRCRTCFDGMDYEPWPCIEARDLAKRYGIEVE